MPTETRQCREPIVELVDVHKAFDGSAVLAGISLDVAAGEVACIIGPSGSGKSTLLRCINGLVPIDRGTIRVGRHQVHALRSDRERIALRKDVAIVFQQYNLFPHKTALQNIALAPRHVLHEDARAAEDGAIRLLDKVHLADKTHAYPGELSGGQQQRVAIARALAMRPKVMLFDEVTAALDPETVKEVLYLIRELAAEGMACIVVTHEMRFAREAASRVHFTDGGVILEHAAPADFFDRPRHPRLQAFLSQVL